MKKYKNGQIVTIKGKKYRITRTKWGYGACSFCAFWKEKKEYHPRLPWACRVYCEKEHLSHNQLFRSL